MAPRLPVTVPVTGSGGPTVGVPATGGGAPAAVWNWRNRPHRNAPTGLDGAVGTCGFAPKAVRKPATAFSKGTQGDRTGVAAAVTVGLMADAAAALAVGVSAASRVCVVSAELVTEVGVSAAAVAGTGVRDCWPLSVVDAPAVTAAATAGCRPRGVTVLSAAAPSVAFVLATEGVEVPRARVDGDGFVGDARWVSLFWPAGLVDEVDDGEDVDVADPDGPAVEEPFVPDAVTGVPPVGAVAVDALSVPPEPAAGDEVPDCPSPFLAPNESLCCGPDVPWPLPAFSLPSVPPLDDVDDFDPAPDPSSAAATGTPLTKAAPIPKATAPVPSHL